MATTINALKSMLGPQVARVFDNGVDAMIYPFYHGGRVYNIEIGLQAEGEYLQFKIPCFLDLSESIAPQKSLVKLLELNRGYKYLKFGLDSGSGEVVVEINIPLFDTAFSQTQLQCCLYALAMSAMEEQGRLLTLSRTGIYPSSDDPGFTERLAQLMPESEAA